MLGELLRKEISAYLAQGPTQKGWDIIFKNGKALKTVQVKTINWPKEKAVNGNLTSGFDFLVVVLLNVAQQHPRYLIFKVNEVESYLSKVNPNRKGKGKRTLTVSNKKLSENGTLKKFENNWRIMR